jgi:hypothetical protein
MTRDGSRREENARARARAISYGPVDSFSSSPISSAAIRAGIARAVLIESVIGKGDY